MVCIFIWESLNVIAQIFTRSSFGTLCIKIIVWYKSYLLWNAQHPLHSRNGFQRKYPSGFPTGITCGTYLFFSSGQGRFPGVTAGCRNGCDINPKPLNEPKGSTGRFKSTTGQPGHSAQLAASPKSVSSALSNVLWGSDCTADLTQMKPFYPLNSPHGTTTTNPAWKSHASGSSKPIEIPKTAGWASICAPSCDVCVVTLS